MASPEGRSRDAVVAATAITVVVLVVAAVFGNEYRSQDFDPQYMRVLVERAARYGGSYYENGIHNKGPLEPVIYQLADLVGSSDGFWLVISVLVAAAAGVVGFAGWVIARRFGAPHAIGAAAAIGIFVHFTLSGSDYAGVLYARNITTTLLAGALMLGIVEAPWRRPWLAGLTAAAIGVLLGLAVQTLVTTALTAVPVLVAVAWWRRERWVGPVRAPVVIVGAAVLTFVSAPLGALVAGTWGPFWSGWWTYARYMNEATGRSLGNQIGLAWHEGYTYYQVRPLAFLVVVGFAVALVRWWRELTAHQRALGLCLLAWWAGAWVELGLSQRYSSHYFSVTSVPTSLMAAALVGWASSALARSRPRPSFVAAGLVVAVLSVFLSGTTPLRSGLEAFSTFSGVGDLAAGRERAQGGQARTVRAVLDLVSDEGDPLLAWTDAPWTYLDLDRVSATRFIWKSFLTGEIYLGRTSEDYVLDETWEWFADDLAQADPPALLTRSDLPIAPDTPFAEVAASDFTEVYRGTDQQLALRNDLAAEVVVPRAREPWVPSESAPVPAGWNAGKEFAHYDGDAGAVSEPLALLASGCVRIDGSLTLATDVPSGVRFRFDDPDREEETVFLGVDAARAWSASTAVEFDATEEVLARGEAIPYSLVVGARSAALVVDGRVRAAVRLFSPVTVGVEAVAGAVELDDLAIGAPPVGSGCVDAATP